MNGNSGKPIVNSWTEWGDLEYIMVGRVDNCCYPDKDPFCGYNFVQDDYMRGYIGEQPLGPRPNQRIKKAEQELNYLVELLKGECIGVVDHKQFDADAKREFQMKRCETTTEPRSVNGDKTIKKKAIEVCRPPKERFDHLLMTPWFKNYYQFGFGCPRDVVITFGNTILESPTASRVRYFESAYYRKSFYKFWEEDKRINWSCESAAPQPTCADSMYDLHYYDNQAKKKEFGDNRYNSIMNETEVAFDAADMMRAGKDIFYKKSASANNKGIDWLRREFPQHRFHMMHFPDDETPHLDVNLIPMRPPTWGSEGVVLINQKYPPLASEMKIFTENDWKPYWCPLPAISELSPVAICSSNLNMNFLSLSSKSCIIEECELPLYHMLDDLGWDVITCPLRSLNEFGGGVHCVTWDIRRNDEYKDFFPNQNYESECEIELNNFSDTKLFPK